MRAWTPIAVAAVALATTSGIAANGKSSIALTSPEVKDGALLPKSATCDGDGKSPALAWKSTSDVMSQALVVDDPDAPKGPYVHWILFDIPKATLSIPHGGSAGVVGTNSADKKAFAPACPPNGSGVHHYRFHLYALDVGKVGVQSGASRADLEKAMKGHVLAESTLAGTYERR